MYLKFNCEVTVERKSATPHAVYGTDIITWVPISYLPGSPPVAERFPAEIQDVLPSRSEYQVQGVAMSRNATRLRLRWRDDIDSTMRVTVHKSSDVVYSVIGGPADVGMRKQFLELVIERYSS